MRTENAIKNIKHILIFSISTVFLSFLNRKIFISNLGAEYVGVNSILTNIISFINLAEVGISSAITFALYAPLKNKDYKKIDEIIYLFKILYRRIAYVAIFIGVIISFNLNIFIKDAIGYREVIIYFYIYIINTVCTYLFTYKYTLAISDQKNYLITATNTYIKIIKHIVQMILLIVFKSYFIWVITEVSFSLIYMYLVNKKISKNYKHLTLTSNKSYKELVSENNGLFNNMKQIVIHKASSFIVFQTDSLLISIIFNLKEVAMYSNYMMIINQIITIISDVFMSISGSIGDLVAERDDNKSYMIWKELYSLTFFIATIVFCVLYIVIDDFIFIWVGNEYIYSESIKCILLINLFISIVRQVELRFKMCYGIYWDTLAPTAEGIINLTFSIILSKYFGIIGVFLGTFISNFFLIVIWSPFITFREGFKKPFKYYIFYTLKLLLISGSSFVSIILINKIINITSNNFGRFIIKSIIILIISVTITFIYMLLDKSFRNILARGIKQWRK